MIEPFFFEVPIYRCNQDAHTAFMASEEEKFNPLKDKEQFPETYNSRHYYFHKDKWFTWRYNEVVGYLNLYIMGSQFRADIWFIDKKRIPKGIIKKKFKYLGKSFETSIPRNASSTEVFEFILQTIESLHKKEYRRFYFDLKTLKVIGQFVDWLELTQKLNSYTYPEHRKKYYESD